MDSLVRRLQMQVMALEEDKEALLQHIKELKHAWCMSVASEDGAVCRDVRDGSHNIAFQCSVCGCWVAYDEHWETGIYMDPTERIHPAFCPNCGRKVVGDEQ